MSTVTTTSNKDKIYYKSESLYNDLIGHSFYLLLYRPNSPRTKNPFLRIN